MQILDINEKPMIRTYHYNAFAESILSSHANYDAWLANNYIQIISYKNKKETNAVLLDYFCGTVFGSIPLLNYEYVNKLEKITSEEKMKYLKEWVDQGKYIYTFVDEFYINDTFSYRKEHYIHDILIFGYDREDLFSVAGYAKKGYTSRKIGVSDLYQALQNDNQCLYKIEPKNEEYRFDIRVFKRMCIEYCEANDSTKSKEIYLDMASYNSSFDDRLFQEAYFGIDIYQELIERLVEFGPGKKRLDNRIFFLINEHKDNMAYKVDYLVNHHYLADAKEIRVLLDDLRVKTKRLINMALKYNMKLDENIIRRMTIALRDIEVTDRLFFSQLIDKIKL